MLAVTASCTTFTSVISPYHLSPRALLCLFAKHPLSQWWMGWLREAGEERTHSYRVLVPSSGQLCSAPPAASLKDCAMASPAFLRPQASTYQTGMCSNEETAPHYHVFRWFFSTAQDARTWAVNPSPMTLKKKKKNRIILPKQVLGNPLGVQNQIIKC